MFEGRRDRVNRRTEKPAVLKESGRKMGSLDKRRAASFLGLLGAVEQLGEMPCPSMFLTGGAQRRERMWDEM